SIISEDGPLCPFPTGMRKNNCADFCRPGPGAAVLGPRCNSPLHLEEKMTVHEMTLTRLLDAPADQLFRCWTTPELMKQWFAPRPYSTAVAEVDLRPGGASNVVMKSPEGQEIPCPGQYLEVVPGKKLVFTDAFLGDWVPK